MSVRPTVPDKEWKGAAYYLAAPDNKEVRK